MSCGLGMPVLPGPHGKVSAVGMHRQCGLICIPYDWCHMVGVAAEVHLAAVVPNMPYLECPIAFPDSPIISELLEPRLELEGDGTIAVPRRPGLGFRLDEDVVREYRVEPYYAAPGQHRQPCLLASLMLQ
jgi:galactonate dehydratase